MLLELDMSPPTMFTLNLNGSHMERAFSPRLMRDLLVNVPIRERAGASSRVRKSKSWWENGRGRQTSYTLTDAERSGFFWLHYFRIRLILVGEKLCDEMSWTVIEFVILLSMSDQSSFLKYSYKHVSVLPDNFTVGYITMKKVSFKSQFKKVQYVQILVLNIQKLTKILNRMWRMYCVAEISADVTLTAAAVKLDSYSYVASLAWVWRSRSLTCTSTEM